MSHEGDVKFYEENLIKTVDKKWLLFVLREWRKETKSQEEARAFADVIDLIMGGDADG